MNTNKLCFKTNINCEGCLSKVKPILDNNDQIEFWEVDIEKDEKILSIKTTLNSDEVIDVIESIGFNAEIL